MRRRRIPLTSTTLKIKQLEEEQGTDDERVPSARSRRPPSALPVWAGWPLGGGPLRLHRHLHPQLLQPLQQALLEPLLVLGLGGVVRAQLPILLPLLQHVVDDQHQ